MPRAKEVRDKGRGKRKLTKGKKEMKTSWQGVSFEAKVSENREKRFDESGRVREEQKTRFCASTVSGRNTENVIDMSSCDNKTEATSRLRRTQPSHHQLDSHA